MYAAQTRQTAGNEPRETQRERTGSGNRLKTQIDFSEFTYSKKSHFKTFKKNQYDRLLGIEIDPSACDPKDYGEVMVFHFIRNILQANPRILEIGTSCLNLYAHFRNTSDYWFLDTSNGLEETPIEQTVKERTIVAYPGVFQLGLPDDSFDLVFCISEANLPTSGEDGTYDDMFRDVEHIVRPGGYLVFSFCAVFNGYYIWTPAALTALSEKAEVVNELFPFERVVSDPDLWTMTRAAYDRRWRKELKKSYRKFGKPFCYTLFFQRRNG
jgi:hypothetical protein